MGPASAYRAKLFRALHAEGIKRGMDHDALRDTFGVKSMSTISTEQLQARLKDWTGKSVRRVTPLPRRGYGKKRGPLEMVTEEDLATLAEAFGRRGMDKISQQCFIFRQLGGKDSVVRTRGDFHKVFSGIRAMNRRDGL